MRAVKVLGSSAVMEASKRFPSPGGRSPSPAPGKKRKPEVKSMLKGVKDKKTRAAVLDSEGKAEMVEEWREKSHILLTDHAGELEAEGMERTFRFKQDDMLAAVGTGVTRNMLNLDLPDHSPYKLAYSRNGRSGHPFIVDPCVRVCTFHGRYRGECPAVD